LDAVAAPTFFWGGKAARADGGFTALPLDPDGCLARFVAAMN